MYPLRVHNRTRIQAGRASRGWVLPDKEIRGVGNRSVWFLRHRKPRSVPPNILLSAQCMHQEISVWSSKLS